MKNFFIVSVFFVFSLGRVCAQEESSEEERTKMRTEMIQRNAERLAKNFVLKGDVKISFMTTYAAYQTEMFETNQRSSRQRFSEEEEKKELSDEEANAKIQEQFTRQAEQIATMQKRLDIQKKYCTEFAKMLTPQQVFKVLTPQRNNQRGQQQRSQNENQRGQGWQGGAGRSGFGGPGGGFGGFGGHGGGF